MSEKKNEYKAFMSYTHSDDEHDNGFITKFCKKLSGEVKAKTGEKFLIFFDKNDLRGGDKWEERRDNALKGSTYFIPIITPSFFKSKECRKELETFLANNRKAGREGRIIPIYYITTSLLENETVRATDKLAAIIWERQYEDLRKLRHEGPEAKEVRKAISDIGSQIAVDDYTRSIKRKPGNEIGFGLKELHKILCIINDFPQKTGNCDSTGKQDVYHNQKISIEIPPGWGICLDTEDEGNVTVIFTDGKSLIEVKISKISDSELDHITKNKFSALILAQKKNNINWIDVYNSSPYDVVNGLWKHYMEKSPILSSESGITGSGSGLFEPDGAYSAYLTNHNRHGRNDGMPLEWSLVWIHPKYKGIFIGVHALFAPNFSEIYNMINIGRGGGVSSDYYWPEPFYKVMTTLKTDYFLQE